MNHIRWTSNAGRRVLKVLMGGMGLLCASLLLACVSLQVQPLTAETFPERPDDTPVTVLQKDPQRPHVKLARLTATSGSSDEDELREKILKAAHKLGADAVVLGKADVMEDFSHGPRWVSTNSPDVQSSLFGGPGSGMPFFLPQLDPWTFEQSEVDARDYTLYLSGVAVRYTDNDGLGDPVRNPEHRDAMGTGN